MRTPDIVILVEFSPTFKIEKNSCNLKNYNVNLEIDILKD